MADEIGMEPPDPTPPLRNINEAQVASGARTAIQAICVWLMGRGYLEEDTSTMLLVIAPSAVVFLGTTLYGLAKQSDWNILRRAARVPSVQRVLVSDPVVAESVPDSKVTTATPSTVRTH